MLTILWLFRRLPRPFKILLALMLTVLVIETLAHTFSVHRQLLERQQHAHTRRSTR
jgi:hypothetical protein